ncbi:beta-N-acetylhexosaminidase [Rubritalea tangerina]|uniref:beta-N-acetylhexosaminidase n=1 Tax=Rubritalea tangerina TaxID=430798 RepID=A0ABW4Z7K3_9BACT
MAATVALCTDFIALAKSPALIPQAAVMEAKQGAFSVSEALSFGAVGGCDDEVAFFASEMRKVTGWKVPVGKNGQVVFEKVSGSGEGYQLEINSAGVTIQAASSAGLFYGFQTLRQLSPVEVFAKRQQASLVNGWELPGLKIQDQPRFEWRGVLVDVSRHFQPKEEMLKLLDSMAMVKLNVLHWHLTDDQGWRPEIKAYPKLTSQNKGKYYSQEDLREIVAYAQERGITIVPEIDVPGHSGAVARAYPELCVAKKDGKGRHNVYDVSNPEVYTFLDNVFGELSAIFPGSYIHLGADEVGKGAWRHDAGCQAFMKKNGIKDLHGLQAHFVGRVSALIRKYGKKPIAWDEALEGGADKGLAIMSWRGVQPGMEAAKHGHKVVLCPVSALYYDRANSRSASHPNGYSANTVTLSQSYYFEPHIPGLSDEAKACIMGAQGCVWGEKIRGGDHLQRQVMLRGAALSEALWSPRASLDWNDFLGRLEVHRGRLSASEVPYWWEEETTAQQVGSWSQLKAEREAVILPLDGKIKRAGLHEFLFHRTQGEGSFHIFKAEMLEDGKVVAEDAHVYTATVEPRRPNQYYLLHLEEFKPGASYALRYTIEPVKGGSSGVVMHLPALEADRYAKDRSPGAGKSNISGQKQPDEL